MPTVPTSKFLIDPNWTIFAAPVQTILQVAEQLGANRQQLLSDAGLDASELKIPDRRFPVSSYFRLFQLASSARAPSPRPPSELGLPQVDPDCVSSPKAALTKATR